ncbi:MAG: hypothetical protein LC731_01280, partial [Acidobacteria bacterium]|nr:hypothetical protein [Acidobacteriota bacterium]
MCRRVLSAWLILLTFLVGAGAPVRCQQQDEVRKEEEQPNPETEEAKITTEEAREAIQVAERFLKGFEEKTYPLSLIDELYVKDFDKRLRKNDLTNYIYLAKVEPEVVAKASDEDLRRLYAASLNYIYACSFLYGIHAYNRKLKGEVDEDDDPVPGDLLPPEAMVVLKTDPLI